MLLGSKSPSPLVSPSPSPRRSRPPVSGEAHRVPQVPLWKSPNRSRIVSNPSGTELRLIGFTIGFSTPTSPHSVPSSPPRIRSRERHPEPRLQILSEKLRVWSPNDSNLSPQNFPSILEFVTCIDKARERLAQRSCRL